MIKIDPYDIAVPAESVRTEVVPKPQPKTEKHEIYERNHIFGPNSLGSDGFDNGVLFSGGDDSLALTHMAMEQEDWGDIVIYLDTGSSMPENVDYVRETCQKYGWNYTIIQTPMDLFTFTCRYGWPGPSQHTAAFNSFKARQLSYLYQRSNGSVKFFSGVRKQESGRRLRNVSDEIQYAEHNFSGWWVSPLAEMSDEWIAEYRDEHNLSRNPISEKIHRSGDCACMAYGHRDTELIQIESEYPDFAQWLKNVEKRTQEYRGRVYLLEDRYTSVATKVAQIRKQTRPNPMKLTVLKEHFPTVYEEIVSVPTEKAILRGAQENTSYMGHGGMSSQALRNLTAEADISQTTLCASCDKPCTTLAPSVRNDMEVASDAFEKKTEQEKLSVDPWDDARKNSRRKPESGEAVEYTQPTLTEVPTSSD